MAKAATRFKLIDLNDADMTMKQAEVLFKEILASETVRKATTFVIDKEICEKENNDLDLIIILIIITILLQYSLTPIFTNLS